MELLILLLHPILAYLERVLLAIPVLPTCVLS